MAIESISQMLTVIVAILKRSSDINRAEREIVELDAFILEVATHKATL